MTPDAESEICGSFHNIPTVVLIRDILNKLVHYQPPTPLKMDNITVCGYTHDNVMETYKFTKFGMKLFIIMVL